ncbi:hypothetical protein [Serratia proteamaculans]|uniref:Helix-turn-helix domain-containing protein n=1 Tax=Serratia proteamaculans TaxID=28151 RepID=A0A5Q2VB17_SERPR|nr:hypothetical protein [Serratia proteamaculans]QGH62727.1 hypothetical protein GHV41_18710 [Serratia proteamaculans]
MHVDWFRIITEVERSGMTQRVIANHLAVAPSTVFYWKQGNQPRYAEGEALIRLWELVTEHEAHQLPYSQEPYTRYRKR